MGLSILFTITWGRDTPRLTLPVGEVTFVIDNNMTSFTGGFWADDTLGRDNLSAEGSLVLKLIRWNSRLVIVWFSFKEVFGGNLRAVEW